MAAIDEAYRMEKKNGIQGNAKARIGVGNQKRKHIQDFHGNE